MKPTEGKKMYDITLLDTMQEENIDIIVHPQTYKDLRAKPNYRENPNQAVILEDANYGTIGTMVIYVSTIVPKDKMYLVQK